MRIDGLVDNLAKAVNDKEVNEQWFTNVWLRVKDDLKKTVLDRLSTDDRAKLAKIMTRFKRKGLK